MGAKKRGESWVVKIKVEDKFANIVWLMRIDERQNEEHEIIIVANIH